VPAALGNSAALDDPAAPGDLAAPGDPAVPAAQPHALAPTAGDPIAEHTAIAAAALVDDGPADQDAGPSSVTPPPARAFAKAARKVRPVPVAQWVNPMPEGSVTSCFGPRWGRLHAGVDLAAPQGTPIRAAGAGVVVAAGAEGGYGNAVLIDHGHGYLTHYGHMLAFGVVAGQHVKVGETIGLEGSTGHSTGPHLHFEVHEGSYKNPIEPTAWMHAHGVDIPGCSADAEPSDDHDHDHTVHSPVATDRAKG
ncbi:M23 family metallopeptidase, partial [Actinoplanes sp. NPDC051633]|uniref:M23 family metallopeptidase n=1 Tax=Actinoplanes sp. NPDC051633 TaxID=3155670 RepID=UPI0034213317